ncbi:TetR/AcrR family transcriptional regulator [Streptomyces qinzhouensis]|uniref:TetR/AcrR family transcriptional regulator n=1 Tax=Streptomyces qinzhouensis TaxID=2599401 RepID=A0A5B8IQ12_9ACTN|nr:TetR/AcrR family transcriptional regulator [Streptomyces qinzhouensis]QDY80768.1 TetR/AcrR family transcriptional regulator [Streptomyces qinzhouensis]
MERVPHPHLRREPVQARSAERLARILDACAELLDESGYEELSTRTVAVRAGVPIGSVYRFFGNKRALVDALAARNLDRYGERVAERVAALPPGDWCGLLDAVLDEYVLMKRTAPGFSLVDFGYRIPVGSPPEGAEHALADRLVHFLAAQIGRDPDAGLRRTVLVAVEAADAVLQLAFRITAEGDAAVIAEARLLLRAYLAGALDPRAAGDTAG